MCTAMTQLLVSSEGKALLSSSFSTLTSRHPLVVATPPKGVQQFGAQQLEACVNAKDLINILSQPSTGVHAELFGTSACSSRRNREGAYVELLCQFKAVLLLLGCGFASIDLLLGTAFER